MRKIIIEDWILWFITTMLLSIFWIGLESVLDGQIINQNSDTVLCLFFSWLIMDKIRTKRGQGKWM